MLLPKAWELLAWMMLPVPIAVAQEILAIIWERLPIKTLLATLVLGDALTDLPKNTELVIFPPLNVLPLPKIVVSFIRVSYKPK